jgi:hypothetical protein
MRGIRADRERKVHTAPRGSQEAQQVQAWRDLLVSKDQWVRVGAELYLFELSIMREMAEQGATLAEIADGLYTSASHVSRKLREGVPPSPATCRMRAKYRVFTRKQRVEFGMELGTPKSILRTASSA